MALGKADRDALVLRFFEQRSFAEVGVALSTTEAAAKMRVGRALCQVTESYHNPATGEWRAAMRFPLSGDRGLMEGSWERRGDTCRRRRTVLVLRCDSGARGALRPTATAS